ncbi:DUF3761 domain-containing protein [Streptomyces sp. NPDC001093]|uniref:DUF3761 domain-containing protein n=1 Tax=Streptomyces sp. NPDC001093 TaxID=3154376 RepID=UPI00332C5ADD
MSDPYAMPPQPPIRTAPRWARKRYVLPAIGLAFFLGVGAGGTARNNGTDAKPAADKVKPTATVTATVTATATATETAKPKPAPTVTATKTVKVTVTVTAHAAAAGSGSGGSSSGGSSGSGDSNSSGGSSSAGNGATALCNDGTYSYAAHHQGACSHHGGVAVFYR